MAPLTEAPTVCATVWNATIAAIGRSISFLYSRRMRCAPVLPSVWICAWVRLRTTASAMEHTNETANDQRITSARTNIGHAAVGVGRSPSGRLAGGVIMCGAVVAARRAAPAHDHAAGQSPRRGAANHDGRV